MMEFCSEELVAEMNQGGRWLLLEDGPLFVADEPPMISMSEDMKLTIQPGDQCDYKEDQYLCRVELIEKTIAPKNGRDSWGEYRFLVLETNSSTFEVGDILEVGTTLEASWISQSGWGLFPLGTYAWQSPVSETATPESGDSGRC